ncbi:MAG: DUF167 domain-containing protein [Burkholderiales bacterium]|nr:DUF167 domain-containing protein [Burkholderiales bacterium]
MSWYRLDSRRNALCIEVHLQPNARSTEVAGLHGSALKIRVSAPPLDQRANDALIGFLADRLGVAPSRVRIARGAKSRSKTVEVGKPDDETLRRVQALIA